jgi:hypothetical protein
MDKVILCNEKENTVQAKSPSTVLPVLLHWQNCNVLGLHVNICISIDVLMSCTFLYTV